MESRNVYMQIALLYFTLLYFTGLVMMLKRISEASLEGISEVKCLRNFLKSTLYTECVRNIRLISPKLQHIFVRRKLKVYSLQKSQQLSGRPSNFFFQSGGYRPVAKSTAYIKTGCCIKLHLYLLRRCDRNGILKACKLLVLRTEMLPLAFGLGLNLCPQVTKSFVARDPQSKAV